MQGYSPVSNPGYQPPYQQGGYPQAPGGYVQAPGGYPQAPGGYGSNPYQAQGYANQPMPPTAMPPVHFAGITYTYVLDPMQELALSPSVLIRQQPQFFEQISGCESPNRYFVFSQSPQTGFKMLFKCKEQSECCQRNCCPPSRREFHMDLEITTNAESLNENFQNSFVHVNKPFKCTCCCLERPEMIANYSANGELVGKVKQPFSCCDPIFTIYDNAGTMRYFIYADCCQCGLCCSGPCAKMSEVTFNIYRDANMGQPIGSIVKKIANFSELITSADSYQVNFPADARPNEKLLLIITGLMIDYQFFEERAGNDDNTGRTY